MPEVSGELKGKADAEVVDKKQAAIDAAKAEAAAKAKAKEDEEFAKAKAENDDKLTPEQIAAADAVFQDGDLAPAFGGASESEQDEMKDLMKRIAKLARSTDAAQPDHKIWGHGDTRLTIADIRLLAKYIPPEALED